jgi:hypothetical protein
MKEFDDKFQEDIDQLVANSNEIIERVSARLGTRISVKKRDDAKIRRNVEYVMARTKEIEDRILAISGILFESPKEKEDLRVTIRIACEFHKFLLDFGDAPPRDEAEFVAETIRSGIDWFMSFATECNYLDDTLSVWSFDRQAISGFVELRRACLRRFDELCRPSASIGLMLASLLAFVHLELAFMAQTYPSLLHSAFSDEEAQW